MARIPASTAAHRLGGHPLAAMAPTKFTAEKDRIEPVAGNSGAPKSETGDISHSHWVARKRCARALLAAARRPRSRVGLSREPPRWSQRVLRPCGRRPRMTRGVDNDEMSLTPLSARVVHRRRDGFVAFAVLITIAVSTRIDVLTWGRSGNE